MTCSKSSKVWFGSNLSLNFSNLPNPDFREWLHDTIVHKDEQTIFQTAAIIYNLWHARNISIFEDIFIPEEVILQRAINGITEYKNANLCVSTQHVPSTPNSNPHQSDNRVTKWLRPEADMVKINSDANLQVNGFWGLGGIIRDSEGLVMATGTWLLPGNDNILEAEAFAMLTVMRFTLDCGFSFSGFRRRQRKTGSHDKGMLS